MHRSQPAPASPRSVALRLEVSRMVLFALLLMSAFLSSMVHVGTVSKIDTFTQQESATTHPGSSSPSGGR